MKTISFYKPVKYCEKIDALLAAAGSDKQHILSAQIWLKNIERDFAAFNEVWVQWMPEGYSPARAAVAGGDGATRNPGGDHAHRRQSVKIDRKEKGAMRPFN